MLQHWKNLTDTWHVGKSIVVVGVLIGVLALAQLLLTHASVYDSVWKAVLLAVAVMVASGIGERFWKKAKVKDASLGPEGANVGFADAIADSVATVNERVDSQVHEINERLYDLEKVVFKDGAPSGDGQ